jgi:hypothetical protein
MNNSTLELQTTGIGLVSLIISGVLVFLFRKKQFGYFDPLSLYIVMRAGPTVASIILMYSIEALFSYYYIITIGAVFVFMITLYHATPRFIQSQILLDKNGVNFLIRIAILLSLIKMVIFYTATGTLPIFGESGSDSYISFAENNKIGSSFLLAIASSELILLSCVIGIARGKLRVLIFIFFILSILLHLANGKKSSLLAVMAALALGEYLRINFTIYKKIIFLNFKYIFIICTASIFWAGFLLVRTTDEFYLPDSNILVTILDIIIFQWAYPTYLFMSGELYNFFEIYQVNKLIYFFHSMMSPLGFPAFSASIGPAFHEYQTGNLTGNGINPTYLLEGYVLFGVLVPIYAFLIALLIGKTRKFINGIVDTRIKILCYALFLPTIYVIPIDALLFMKEIMGLILLSPLLFILYRSMKNV